MTNKEQELNWDELKNIWMNSSQTKHIHLQITDLVNELKDHMSSFEKDMIKKDMAALHDSWKEFKGGISQFEKDSITNDLNTIKKALNKLVDFFKGGK